MRILKLIAFTGIIAIIFNGCGSSEILSTPIENIDSVPLKVSDLTEAEKHNWGHLDLVKDTIPGMSVDKAYAEIIQNKKGKTVIVAVIDSGIDIDHEDLDGVIWTNKDEIPNNGKDDDKNGYIDDIHGWNFLGEAYDEQLEYTRLLASGKTDDADYSRAQSEYQETFQRYSGAKGTYEQIVQQLSDADKTFKSHFKKDTYTYDEINAIKTEDETLKKAVSVAQYYRGSLDSFSAVRERFDGIMEQINDFLDFYLNKDFNGRKTGDNPNDISQTNYGNNNVKHSEKGESHGTHVAGIIAAERNNGLGANGVANNVEIMAIRVVPNGDEYDKDVALGIRYAVDNGAKIINTSFGKYYSPHSQWVRDAIAYAGEHDVLIVNAAGNEGIDLDKKDVFPNDAVGTGPEVSDNFISVGALEPKYGSGLLAGFSNYGKVNVDVFAPGAKIYSTTPENEYDTKGGTSMAAPAVAGVAALIRSYYPKLSASQVKYVIMNSGLPLTTKVVVGGDANDVRPFGELTKSGTIVNAYNALILASKTK